MEEFNAESIVSKVSEFCQQHQIPLTLSSIVVDGSLTSHAKHRSTLDEFLKFVEAIKPTFVSITKEKIDGLSYQQQLGELEHTNAKLYDELISLREQINKMGQVELSFFSDFGRVIHTWALQSRAYELVYEHSELFVNDDEDFDDSHKYISDEDVEQFAKKVAHDPKLEKSDTLASIELILKRELKGHPKKILAVHMDTMVRNAQAIFRTEIKPALEMKQLELAESLREQGLKKSEIARRMKITLQKLNKII